MLRLVPESFARLLPAQQPAGSVSPRLRSGAHPFGVPDALRSLPAICWTRIHLAKTFEKQSRLAAKFLILWLALLLGSASALTGPDCLVVSEAGSLSEVESMLESHTPAQLFKVRDSQGRGLLHYCVKREPAFWRALIVAGWPVKQEKGWTPQHEACLLGKLDALQLMVENGADLEAVEPVNGGTPLQVAAFNGHFEIVKFLVTSGAKVNARDKDRWTALSQARDQGFPKIVDWLKKNGATR